MEQSQNKMGTSGIRPLMIKMSVPMILSMMLQALYNIVDSAFLSAMKEGGEDALNALTLAFPVQMLIVAMGIGTGVGAGALLSKSLGRGDKKTVSLTSGNSVFLGGVIYLVFLLFGFFGTKPYILSQTQNPVIAEAAEQYLFICLTGSFGIVFFSVFEKLLQSTGRSALSTVAQITGAAVNVVLDPILIFGLLGAPELGVRGAAYATVIGQIASFALALIFHLRFNREIDNSPKYIVPNGKIIAGIYKIGVPAIISQALMSVMTYGINLIFGRTVGEGAVTAYGLYYKIQQIVLFAAFGIRDAITPIVAFNCGMGDRARVKEAARFGVLFTEAVMLAGLLIAEIFASPICSMFELSDATRTLFLEAIRIVSPSLLFAGLCIAFQGIFQALDCGVQSLVISLCRQLVFVLPAALGLSLVARTTPSLGYAIWFAFPAAELLSAIVGYILMRNISRRKIDLA